MTFFLSLVSVLLLAAVSLLLFLQWQAQKAAREKDAASQQWASAVGEQMQSLRTHVSETLHQQTQAVSQQLSQVGGQVNLRLESVNQQMLFSQKTVGDRLDNAARVVGEVQKTLGQLGEASQRIFEVGKDVAGLQDLLRAPKMRGGLGEFLLEDLLKQVFPLQHFETQYTFKTGDRVDAALRIGGKLVPVDAKFPLENFRRVLASAGDDERRSLRRKFMGDVRKHIDAVAGKYILPDEGTYDFALLYIPSESVFHEVFLGAGGEAESDASLTEYALSLRVIPVSPNSFYAYLQVILLGLRGYQIEQSAREIMENLSRLRTDFDKFMDEFSILGRHISNTRTKYEDAEKRLTRFQDKLISVSPQEVSPIPSLSSQPLPDVIR